MFRGERQPLPRSDYDGGGHPQGPQETKRIPFSFIERPIVGIRPARCVDGREDPQSLLGPQMPAGSIHVILIDAIYKGYNVTPKTLETGFTQLRHSGYKPGLHRGHHNDPQKNISDCGAADRAQLIFAVAQGHREKILERLRPVYAQHADLLGPITMLETAYEKIKAYDQKKITITGEKLVATAENLGANVEKVAGNHCERIAFINLKPGITFDTKTANNQGWQAFNVDVIEVMKQAIVFGIDPFFAAAVSLPFYVATKMVLVEKYGIAQEPQPGLPVKLHR